MERHSGLRPGFFGRGLITAVLSEGGTWPEFNKWFIICLMRGLMADRLDLMSALGSGYRGGGQRLHLFDEILNFDLCDCSESA